MDDDDDKEDTNPKPVLLKKRKLNPERIQEISSKHTDKN